MYGTRHSPEWQSEFPFISSRRKETVCSSYCGVCQKDVSYSHQRISDLKRHEISRAHRSLAQAMQSSGSLDATGFVLVGSFTDNKVRINLYLLLLCICLGVILLNCWQIKRAEVKMAVALDHHNILLAVMDHLSPLFQSIFPDSKIAKGFAAARTKTTCILNMALRPHLQKNLVLHMSENPFALEIDGSNDNDLQKMNPVTVRVLHPDLGRVSTKFLDMCLTYGTGSATAQMIFEAMDGALQSSVIPWTH